MCLQNMIIFQSTSRRWHSQFSGVRSEQGSLCLQRISARGRVAGDGDSLAASQGQVQAGQAGQTGRDDAHGVRQGGASLQHKECGGRIRRDGDHGEAGQQGE